MKVDLAYELGKTYTKDYFIKNCLENSSKNYSRIIGLDGLVDAATFHEKITRKTSADEKQNPLSIDYFDHHGNDGAKLPASCKQVYTWIVDHHALEKSEREHILVTANHSDEDVFAGYYLIKNAKFLKEHTGAAIALKYFVDAEDIMDSSQGTQLARTREMNEILAWAFEPYHAVRYSGDIYSLKEDELVAMTGEVAWRIHQYGLGKGKRTVMNDMYSRKRESGVVAEYLDNGPFARYAELKNGAEVAISYIPGGEIVDNKGHRRMKGVVLWRRKTSEAINLDLATVDLNKAEIAERIRLGLMPADVLSSGREIIGLWGGGLDYRGCPRDGTVLSREQIFDLVLKNSKKN